MLPYIYFITCLGVFVGFFIIGGASPWASPALEKQDELHDIEIYNAVVSSMNQWERRKRSKLTSGRRKRDEPSVCYPELGCFDASGPFGYLDMLPSTPEEISTKFLLYPGRRSRRNVKSYAEVPFTNLTDAFKWAEEGFNKSLPTKILIHGFGSDCTHIWVYEMRSALMSVDEVNVICVDWENGAVLPNYVKAAANTRLVGKQLSMLLKGLIKHNALSEKSMHLIGFSLGAHVAGFAGAEIGNLSRITGLDPAGPLFESQDPRARLDQTDAEFVDVIHSNGENLILGGLGSWQPMGHVDFYPNGGRMQKGCTNLFVGAVSDIIWSSAVEGRSLCNHRRAYKFFTDSVAPKCHFPAFPCETYEDFIEGRCFPCGSERDCGNMGYYADHSVGRGQLYLITRDEEPFCANQYHVKIQSSPTIDPVVSYGKIQITLIGDNTLNETFTMTRKDDEEMKLGESISRIIVPHPILSEPTKIQIVYTAYSGWLSSGRLQWKIDKVTLSDSFGKSSSICKRNLILESKIPVTLPLYPGDCNTPTENAEKRNFNVKMNSTNATDGTSIKSKFVPTPVVRIGNEIIHKEYYDKDVDDTSFIEDSDFLNLGWKTDNSLEKESSRALNTRVVKMAPNDLDSDNSTEVIREILEPVLKPHSVKNARSHDPDRDKPEISEPILRSKNRPTTEKSTSWDSNMKITYNFYDVANDDWVPSNTPKSREKWKREDDSKSNEPASDDKTENSDSGFDLITMTVQFLPQRLARMFEQAEKYARETILPLISSHTPKIIRDFIAPESTPKYVPLIYEETTASVEVTSQVKREVAQERNLESQKSPADVTTSTTKSTTHYTHIQKIRKNVLIFPQTTEDSDEGFQSSEEPEGEGGRSIANGVDKNEVINVTSKTDVDDKNSTAKRKEIHIDLPVIDNSDKGVKYIPLSYSGNEKQEKVG